MDALVCGHHLCNLRFAHFRSFLLPSRRRHNNALRTTQYISQVYFSDNLHRRLWWINSRRNKSKTEKSVNNLGLRAEFLMRIELNFAHASNGIILLVSCITVFLTYVKWSGSISAENYEFGLNRARFSEFVYRQTGTTLHSFWAKSRISHENRSSI